MAALSLCIDQLIKSVRMLFKEQERFEHVMMIISCHLVSSMLTHDLQRTFVLFCVLMICVVLYSVHASLVFCLQKISVCSDDISMIMTSFIDDLSQLNVKQGTSWVFHCMT